ncbi:hypothetical protein [Zavarzinella formosa]|uniref:hypothetical protein n=1 Tax=Zavarzinella formosa TaxID=360055 RepID=UPI0002E1BF48|nr:hypothetical protein [Zavarzinella formosa]
MNIYFLYDFEIPASLNPAGTLDRIREDLRAYFESRGWDNYGMGALGGSLHLYGDVSRKNRPVTEQDRLALGEWARNQRFRGTVRLGAVESGDSHLRKITEWVFEVDNLSEAERAEADARDAELRQRVEAARRKPASP